MRSWKELIEIESQKPYYREKLKPFVEAEYAARRVFLPMSAVEKHYPFFYRHKILLPFLPLYRLIRNRKQVQEEFKAIK